MVAPHVPTPTTKVRDFARMNPPEFHGSKVDKDAQEFIDEVYKVLTVMGVTSKQKVELAAYQFKGVAQVWSLNGYPKGWILMSEWLRGLQACVS